MGKMPYIVDHAAIVILAAGESRRLGNPKQLLLYKGRSLLHHATDVALKTKMRPVVVVIGANGDTMRKEMKGVETELVENKEWKEGMASSLRCGLTAVQKMSTDIDGIIFMVCDQPYVTKKLLNNLIQVQQETGLPIVAGSYKDKPGTPVLFHKSIFKELMALKGDVGARKLLAEHMNDVATVLFPKGDIDIDTAEEYGALMQNKFS